MKRKTKAQREEEQKAALLQRLHDIYSGALGERWGTETNWATAEILTNAMSAAQQIFGDQVEDSDWCWNVHCIKRFDTPESACEHLFSQGFRA